MVSCTNLFSSHLKTPSCSYVYLLSSTDPFFGLSIVYLVVSLLHESIFMVCQYSTHSLYFSRFFHRSFSPSFQLPTRSTILFSTNLLSCQLNTLPSSCASLLSSTNPILRHFNCLPYRPLASPWVHFHVISTLLSRYATLIFSSTNLFQLSVLLELFQMRR